MSGPVSFRKCAARRYARNAPIRIIPLEARRAPRNLSVCAGDFDALPAFCKNFLDILFDESR